MALTADWDSARKSKKAKRRRKKWEIELLAKRTDVMIGTLEMACETRSNENAWTTKLILVDEAGQATEPMTIIPFLLANADTHIVLIGDHMQLTPTVLSTSASCEGLGPVCLNA